MPLRRPLTYLPMGLPSDVGDLSEQRDRAAWASLLGQVHVLERRAQVVVGLPIDMTG
jgi:hypothetical protein